MQYSALEGRYELLKELGRGGQGVTWQARALESGQLVAIKVLELRDVQDWKQVELIEREAKTLQSLDHPAIPDYVDFIRDDQEDGQLRLFMVQELVQGQTLEQELREQGRWDEAKLKQDAAQLLKILAYLHNRVPPVVHRDIKPSNIIRSQSDGRLYLIDFGAVRGEHERSTMIGTPGYMPLEQLVSRTQPKSDLYSLGVTLFRLLTGVDPIDVELRDGKLDYLSLLEHRSGLSALLDKMIEPNVESRLASAQRALALLSEPAALASLRAREDDAGRDEAARAPLLDRVLERDRARNRQGYHFTKTGWMPLDDEPLGPISMSTLKQREFRFVGRHLALAKQTWSSVMTRGAIYHIDVQAWEAPSAEIYLLTTKGDQSSGYVIFSMLEDGTRVFLGDVELGFEEESTVILEGEGSLGADLDTMRAFLSKQDASPLKGLSAPELFKAAHAYFMPCDALRRYTRWPLWGALPVFVLTFWFVLPVYFFATIMPYHLRARQLEAGGKIEDPIKYAASLQPRTASTDDEPGQLKVTFDFDEAQAAQDQPAPHAVSQQGASKR